MSTRIMTMLALIAVLARPAVCESVRDKASTGWQWFGASAKDFAEKDRYAGRALRIKARFVRELTGGARMKERRDGTPSPIPIVFLVAAGGGEIRCEVSARSKCGSVVHGMKRATPLVIHGTLGPRQNVFLVNAIVQGWGRDQMKGNP